MNNYECNIIGPHSHLVLGKEFPCEKHGKPTFGNMTNNNWEEEFREYFDKTLKPKKPTIKNLDRELCINFISNLLTKKDQEHKAELEIAYNKGMNDIIKSAESCKDCNKPIHIHPHDFYDNSLDCNCDSHINKLSTE